MVLINAHPPPPPCRVPNKRPGRLSWRLRYVSFLALFAKYRMPELFCAILLNLTKIQHIRWHLSHKRGNQILQIWCYEGTLNTLFCVIFVQIPWYFAKLPQYRMGKKQNLCDLLKPLFLHSHAVCSGSTIFALLHFFLYRFCHISQNTHYKLINQSVNSKFSMTSAESAVWQPNLWTFWMLLGSVY